MWAELWTLPELASFAVLRSVIPGVVKVQDKHTGIGRGSVTVPADWSGVSAIMSTTAGSLIRVFRRDASGGRVAVFEFTPETVATQYGENKLVTVTGPSIEAKLDQAALLTFDWPLNPSLEPDWRWGLSDELLTNGGFEDDAQSLINPGAEDGSTKGWRPTIGSFAPTSFTAISNAGNADVGTWYFEIVGGIGSGMIQNFTRSLVVGETYTVTARLYVPTGKSVTLEVVEVSSVSVGTMFNGAAVVTIAGNDAYQTATVTFVAAASTTPGISILSETATTTWRVDEVTASGYGIGTLGWDTRGTVGTFQTVSSPVDSGTVALSWKPTSGTANADGIFQQVNVVPGQSFTASVRVRHTEAANKSLRLLLRGPGVDAGDAIATTTTSVVTATWTTMTVTAVPTVSPIVVEAGWNETGAPTNVLVVDTLSAYQGRAPETVGEIVGELLTDVQTDHSAESSPFDIAQLLWLKKSFSDTVDSASNAWPADINISLPAGLTFGQVMDRLTRLGYEWSITPNPTSADTETHLLNIYNPWSATAFTGGTGSDKRATVKITTGQAVLTGPLKLSEQTRTVAYTVDPLGNIAASRDATGETNWGQRVAGSRESHVFVSTALQQVADQVLTDRTVNTAVSTVKLLESQFEPYNHFAPGDTITFGLPPDLADAAHRVTSFTYDVDDQPTVWIIDFGRTSYPGLSGTVQAVDRLLRKAADPTDDSEADVYTEGVSAVGVGPIERDFLIAASDSRPELIAVADYKCSGTADDIEWNQALTDAAAVSTGGGAEVVVASGTYTMAADATITIPVGVGLVGPHWQSVTGTGRYAVWVVPDGDITFDVNGYMEWISLAADVGG